MRLWVGAADSVIGTGVNTLWIGYDLLVLSVIWRAALYRGTHHNHRHPALEREYTS